MTIKIKRTNILDEQMFARITEIWRETGISNPARADHIEAIRYNLEHGGILLIAYDNDLLVGTVWLSHDHRRLYIHHMAVAVEKQNLGIGKLLLEEAIAISEELGYQAKLEVHKDNPAARHLYSSLGFTDLDGYITMIKRN